MRPYDHDGFYVFWNRIHVEKVQLFELDIFVFDKGLQNGDRATFLEWWFLVTEDVAKDLLFSLDKIDHRTRDGLFAFECGYSGAFAKCHSALIDVSHLGGLDRLVASFVIDD